MEQLRTMGVIKFIFIIGGVIIAALLGVLIRNNSVHESAMLLLNQEKAEYQSELDALKARGPRLLDVDAMRNHLDDVNKKANAIAELQDTYQTAEMDDIRGISDDISVYMKSGARDGAGIWYDNTALPNLSWEYAESYVFSSEAIDVLWIARDGVNGPVMAYTTGLYDISDGLFFNVKSFTTLEGNAALPGTISNPGEGYDDVIEDDDMDSFVTEEPETEVTEDIDDTEEESEFSEWESDDSIGVNGSIVTEENETEGEGTE